jgi:hypothetical protein
MTVARVFPLHPERLFWEKPLFGDFSFTALAKALQVFIIKTAPL